MSYNIIVLLLVGFNYAELEPFQPMDNIVHVAWGVIFDAIHTNEVTQQNAVIYILECMKRKIHAIKGDITAERLARKGANCIYKELINELIAVFDGPTPIRYNLNADDRTLKMLADELVAKITDWKNKILPDQLDDTMIPDSDEIVGIIESLKFADIPKPMKNHIKHQITKPMKFHFKKIKYALNNIYGGLEKTKIDREKMKHALKKIQGNLERMRETFGNEFEINFEIRLHEFKAGEIVKKLRPKMIKMLVKMLEPKMAVKLADLRAH